MLQYILFWGNYMGNLSNTFNQEMKDIIINFIKTW